jgi:hypothetical protein
MAKPYHTVDRNKLNILFAELSDLRENFREICLTPCSEKSNRIKNAELKSLDTDESYLIMEIVKTKGLLTPGKN